MGRILFWVLLGFVVYLAWRWWNVKQRLPDERRDASVQKKTGQEPMVPCDVCGLNVPKSEAFAGNGRWYCSDEHRRLGPG
ncbi:MAG TPA: PP0621 family protein [Burkholderiaceae bacterium]|nr:PP0621 family protein [Burkholderiaceae bacterium]